MPKYKVTITKEIIVDANDEGEAHLLAWEKLENGAEVEVKKIKKEEKWEKKS